MYILSAYWKTETLVGPYKNRRNGSRTLVGPYKNLKNGMQDPSGTLAGPYKNWECRMLSVNRLQVYGICSRRLLYKECN